MKGTRIHGSSIFPIFCIVCGLIFSTFVIISNFVSVNALNNKPLDNSSRTALLPNFSFAAAGDWACTSTTISTVNNLGKKNPNLVLGLGDYYYSDYTNESHNPDCWFKITQPIDQKMKIAIGNHESESPLLLKLFMAHFNLTKEYYSFNYHNVHFVVLSTETALDNGSDQYNFIKSDLAKTASDPKINWIVSFYHRKA